MKKIYLKPAEGITVPDPELGGHLPPEGREVNDSPYWRRRLKDKSVILADAPADPAPKKPRKPAAPAPGDSEAS